MGKKISKKWLVVLIAAVAVLVCMLALVLTMCAPGQSPEVPTTLPEDTAPPETTTEPAPEVPVKVWDMEQLPENLIAEGMAYAKSNENIYGNLVMGAAPGKGLGGSQAFAYTFVGDYSEGDVYVMSPKSLKDPNFVANWSNGEMLWFWVNGVELMQTVRLEVVVNGIYTPFESLYYTVDAEGKCVEAGSIPRAWGETTKRGRIQIPGGWYGWIGLPLESFGSPELITSLQIHVGNSTVKAGNVLYLDEFWLTELGQVPPLTLQELTYDGASSLTLGQIWDVEKVEAGTEVATVGTDSSRGNITSTAQAGVGVLKSNAVAYRIQDPAKTNTQNVDFNVPGLVRYGAAIRGIEDPANLVWFWVDSELSSDQLLHIQLNGVFMDDGKGVYTIVDSYGMPKMQQVAYRSGKGMVNGVSVVPYNGTTGGKYARIELSAGWSGWIGVPVENFCVNSDGTAAELPSGRVAKLTFRLFGTKDTLKKGDTLYFDEFWITEAGKMPELSTEALLYGYTPSYVRPTVTYGRIWNAEGGSNADGIAVGKVETNAEWNKITGHIAAGKGVAGSQALRYRLESTGFANSANLLLETGDLEKLDFKTALVTEQSDILWLWVDSAVQHDQLLHLQVNGRLMGLGQSIYTVAEENGKPVLKKIDYCTDGALVTGGIGLVPANGKVQSADTTYARIKLCDGWSGWIGVPVGSFNMQSGEKVTSAIRQINKYQIRSYVTNKDVLDPGDLMYIDELWLTKAGQMPDVSEEALLYGYTADTGIETITYGQIWDADDAAIGAAVGTVATDTDKNTVSAIVTADQGISGKQALTYSLLNTGNGNSNNLTLEVAQLESHGFKLASVTKDTDILWLWVDSAVDHDQLLHLQVNTRLMGLGKSIYTIVDENSQPALLEVPYTPDGALVTQGIGVVPANGKEETESTTYARIKLCDGWSGWIGVPVGSLNMLSGQKQDTVIQRVDKLQLRSYVTNKDVLNEGALLHFDALWLTKAGEMPQLSSAELLYGATAYEEPEAPFTYGQIWDAERVAAGTNVGQMATDAKNNPAESIVIAGQGVSGKNALAYRLKSIVGTNGNNVTLEAEKLKDYGFKLANVTDKTDLLWLWVDSAADYDQLLHLQVNGRLMGKGQSIYTITDENGTAVLTEVAYTADGAQVTAGIGVVPSDGKAETASTTYTRIKLCGGWSGWIGVPVGNFNVQSGAVVDTVIGKVEKLQIRNFVTSKEALARGDNLYIDEVWLTEAGKMPALSNQELLYTYTPPVYEVKLSQRYGNGMIFQQNKPWQIHGTGVDGQTVSVALVKDTVIQQTASAVVANGSWCVQMAPVTGGYDSYEVQITNTTETHILYDVVFGEVWIAGGQSNMAYTVSQITSQEQQAALQAKLQALEKAGDIRFFTQNADNSKDGALTEPAGYWSNANQWEDVFNTSATGIYVALQLQAELDVPVGFVVAAVGGTGLTSWVSPEVAATYHDYYTLIQSKNYHQTSADAKDFLGGWYNSRVAPWQGYEAAGMLWYQGEHERSGNSAIQSLGIEVLVESWSKVFDSEGNATATELPLIAMQIAPYATASSDSNLVNNYTLNAAMREGIAKVTAKGGTAEIVCQYDLYVTVNDIHPRNKPELAVRVADTVLGLVYGKQAVYSGPVVKDVVYGDGVVTITFQNVGQGLQYIQLNETDNYRVLEEGHDLNTAEFYADKLGGFTVHNGTELLDVDAEIISADQVKITLPAGTAVSKVYYGYGAQILSSNLFNAEGFPAVPFCHENDSYVPAAQQTLLMNFDSLTAGDAVGTVSTVDNYGPVTSTVGANGGVSGSQALVYSVGEVDYNHHQNVQLDAQLSAHAVRDGSDILWFWVDSDLSNQRLLHVQVNGTLLQSEDIYTIVSNNGTPEIKKVSYVDDRNAVSVMAPVNANWSGGGSYARIKLPAGWYGWIGIPMENVGITSGSIEKVQLRIYGDRNAAPIEEGEVLYFDELWLTSAGLMPNLSDAELLHAGDEVVKQSLIWNAEHESLTDGYDLSSLASTNYDAVSATVQASAGVSGSKALAYAKTTNSNNQSSNFTLKSGAPGFAGVELESTDVLWFWVDSELASDRLLHVQLNNSHLGKAYIYTIVESAGAPTIKRLDYDASGLTEGDGLALIASAGNAAANASYARIRLDAGWYGWIGIPVENFNGNDTSVPTGSVSSVIFRLAGGKGLANETVYFDEFWLTGAGLMPNLSDAELLHNGDPATVTTEKAAPLMTLSDAVSGDLKAKSYFSEIASNNQPTSYFTFGATSGKGYSDSKAFGLGFADANPGNYTNWAALDLTDATAKTELGISGAEGVSSTAILWFWVDGTALSADARINVKVNGAQNKLGGYYYTVEQSGDGYRVSEPISLVKAGTNATGTVSAGTEGNVPVAKNWCGWIGIPLSNFSSAQTLDVTKLDFHLKKTGNGAKHTAGSTVYMSDFCIGDWLGTTWELPVA